jgi:hypothetical protein
MVYLRKDINWKKDGIRFLTASLRIEKDDLGQVPLKDFDEIFQSIHDRRTRNYLTGFRKELSR